MAKNRGAKLKTAGAPSPGWEFALWVFADRRCISHIFCQHKEGLSLGRNNLNIVVVNVHPFVVERNGCSIDTVGDQFAQINVGAATETEMKERKDLIDDARSQGLTLLQGAPVPEKGYFVPLTLVDNPPDTARVVVEEAFGPVLPLLKFSNVDEVVSRANDSEYGLAGAVWSNDLDQAQAIAHRLDTGTVWINQNLQSTPFTPLAGAKQSGFGQENGLPGLLEFTRPKAIYIKKHATA